MSIELSPAFWSAVAATFAALSSLLNVRIQRRNFLESVRPELVLEEWSRNPNKTDPDKETIHFRKIRNVGRGAALHVFIGADGKSGAAQVAFMHQVGLPIIAPNDGAAVNGSIRIFWKDVVPNRDGQKFVTLHISMHCIDSHGLRHEIHYRLGAIERRDDAAVANAIAPGLMLVHRRTTAVPSWRVKLRSWRVKVRRRSTVAAARFFGKFSAALRDG